MRMYEEAATELREIKNEPMRNESRQTAYLQRDAG